MSEKTPSGPLNPPTKPVDQMTDAERARDRIFNTPGDASMRPITPQCKRCEWYDYANPSVARCRVFQDGIPMAILTNEHDHRLPYPGDNGFRFQPKTATAPIE